MIVNQELYDRWRTFAVRWGAAVPKYDEDLSLNFFLDFCNAVPLNLRIEPLEKPKKRKPRKKAKK